ncbi:hypothetical protein CHS0354_030332 [Potamilus streckersoni]|uniref:Glycolipid transfer protein domain-containing protein n=1 Tax=Potamilus streckersoni TaxID=2493646 RepID=A0AAE0T591_9BIVA|nr:hypothetical protein CHS0354_030332 [Potamilus streckersoni]
MAATDAEHFDLQKLHNLYATSKAEEGLIEMDPYIASYNELTKLFKILGSVFGFIVSDVVEKVGILQEYRKSDVADNYKTVQGMLQFEVDTKNTNTKHKPSASRTLLRLHRALAFVADFMKEIQAAEEGSKLSSIAATSYDRTLAKHHPWIVRKGVHLAVYTLPTRKHLLEKMKVENNKKTEELLGKVAESGKKIFDVVEDLYTKHDLHSLP